MATVAIKLFLLVAVLFQASPLRACGVEKAVTGENCHDQRVVVTGEALLHCNDVGGAASPAEGDVPGCLRCEAKSPVERKSNAGKIDLNLSITPVLLYEAPSTIRFPALPSVFPQSVALGRILPLLN